MILYSKEGIVSSLLAMQNKGRMAHSFLLVGEKGVGKKVMADYIAMLLMCENKNACGECRHCKKIINNTHPDVIRPERSGKKLIYNRETLRNICSDAYVSPNDSDCKIYIFADSENIEESNQNLMLKLIEEPPDTVYFVFTAVSRSFFLPTILSRVITLGVNECTESDCMTALKSMNKYSDSLIEDAVKRFHGNIGSCIDFLDGTELAKNSEICRRLIDSMIISNEYEIIKTLASIGENRDSIKNILMLADKVIRDACIIRVNEGNSDYMLIGCYPEGAQRLSTRMSFKRAEAIHEAILKTIDFCGGNVNVSAAMSALGGMLI